MCGSQKCTGFYPYKSSVLSRRNVINCNKSISMIFEKNIIKMGMLDIPSTHLLEIRVMGVNFG